MNNDFWKKYFGNAVGLAPIQPSTKPLLKKVRHSKRLVNEEMPTYPHVDKLAFLV